MPLSSSQATCFPVADPQWSAATEPRCQSLSWSPQHPDGRTAVARPGPWFATSPTHHTPPSHDPCRQWCLSQSPAVQGGSRPKPKSECKRAPQWRIEGTIVPPSVDLSHWGLHDDMPGHLVRGFSKSNPSSTWLSPSTTTEDEDPTIPDSLALSLPVVGTWPPFRMHAWSRKRPGWPCHPRTVEWWVTNDDSKLLGTQSHSSRFCRFAHGWPKELVWSPSQRSSEQNHHAHLGAIWPHRSHSAPAAQRDERDETWWDHGNHSKNVVVQQWECDIAWYLCWSHKNQKLGPRNLGEL